MSGLAGVALLLRNQAAPPPAVVVPVSFAGALFAVSGALFPIDATIQLLVVNFLTLSVVRPTLGYVGLIPHRLATIVWVAMGSAALAIAGEWAAVNLLGIGAGPALLLGVGLGCIAAGLASAWIRVERRAPVAEGPAQQPHWQRCIVALAGSSSPKEGLVPREWSQQGLATSLGISPKRVSEFPEAVNGLSAERIRALWPSVVVSGRPPWVVTHRGLVEGARGVRTYYRLTPEGEKLAACLRDEEA
jgi:hypothetical protein